MTRAGLVGIAALVLVTPALAQVINVQRIPTPNIIQVQPQDEETSTAIVTDPAKARETIIRLNREKRELNAKLTEALATIDQYTAKGGSLVHSYCESEDVSRSTAGATENCAESGYRCAPVEGTCRRTCNVTTDCAGYFTCDTAAHVCVRTG
jgi:hypothetical protein